MSTHKRAVVEARLFIACGLGWRFHHAGFGIGNERCPPPRLAQTLLKTLSSPLRHLRGVFESGIVSPAQGTCILQGKSSRFCMAAGDEASAEFGVAKGGRVH